MNVRLFVDHVLFENGTTNFPKTLHGGQALPK